MLKRIGQVPDLSGAMTTIRDAVFPAPFPSELEYSCSARGTWNIVHTGFLVPETHEIFVCASGCLRGVVLTAAECGLSGRFSTIEIREENVLDGDLEELLINGVSDIIEQLPERPRAVLVYTSCIHHFIGCDTMLCYQILRKRFPDIDFTDCYMNPIMRKSGLTPDQIMRRQLYSLWHQPESGQNPRKLNIIGNNLPTQKHSELYQLAELAGYELTEIHDCKNYHQYQEMACAMANLCYNPTAKPAGEMLASNFNQKLLYLPVSYSDTEIRETLATYAGFLGIPEPDTTDLMAQCEQKAQDVKKIIGDTPIMIDYTATMRPLSLARFLLAHDFRVTRIYADSFTQEEVQDFQYLQEHFPELEIYATVHIAMRMMPRESPEKTLAIGQKAAYFLNTPYFVNMVENNGFWGFSGILDFLELLRDAFLHEKDTRKLVQIKGVGCGTACL